MGKRTVVSLIVPLGSISVMAATTEIRRIWIWQNYTMSVMTHKEVLKIMLCMLRSLGEKSTKDAQNG